MYCILSPTELIKSLDLCFEFRIFFYDQVSTFSVTARRGEPGEVEDLV